MKINSINSNQSFGKLKITATKDGEKYREQYLGNESSAKFDELDFISGKTPIEINFDAFIDPTSAKDSLPYLTCNIAHKKTIFYNGIRTKEDLDKQIECIKRQLLKEKEETMARKYFA